MAVSSDGTNVEYRYCANALTIGVWNDIALTYDAGTFKVYVNGVSLPVDANFSTQLSVFAGSDPVNIGYANWAGYYTEGQLAGLKIWNKALTATEIKEFTLVHQ